MPDIMRGGNDTETLHRLYLFKDINVDVFSGEGSVNLNRKNQIWVFDLIINLFGTIGAYMHLQKLNSDILLILVKKKKYFLTYLIRAFP